MRSFVRSRSAPWMSISVPELSFHIEQYLASLRRENASEHTIRNYGVDLRAFKDYFSVPVPLAEMDVFTLREWMASLYDAKLSAVTIRRKLAAVRSLFTYLERNGTLSRNVAKLVRTPKVPQTLPSVMTPEQTNDLIDLTQGKADELGRSDAKRDVALLEFLYGCGLRVSELVGLNFGDFDFADRWIVVRGKGRKERQVPYGESAAIALEAYLDKREKVREQAIFLNSRGGRLSDRGVRNIVKLYARWILRDPSQHPHSFRHAYATHMLADGADLRSIQELLGHAKLSTTQRYTQLDLAELMVVYDRSHPKA